ncbi:MAG TPA: alcohol dehydrogenase catalytic domain-containing protein [Deinococcales bacterium]|nr:alcohol dehydrogenase catalytic domain-containing protein [Deinococcales bacterium]
MASSQTSMRAAVFQGDHSISLEEVAAPTAPPGWSLVEVSHVGICGTDLAIFAGYHPRAKAPLIMGHEFSGRIVEPGATGLDAGQSVVVEPLMACGRCAACRSGNAHVCKTLRLFGIDYPGGMAQYMVAPPERVYAVPEALPADEAAVIEPLAVAVHAVRISRFRPGDTVAVLGAGPVGLLTALVLRASGAGSVIVTEANPFRMNVARQLGFTTIDASSDPVARLLELTGGDGADLVFDAAGHPTVAASLVDACRINGQIMLVGIYKKPTALDLQGISFKEIDVKGSRVYTPEDFRIACSLAASGRVALKPLISHVLPLGKVAEGFEVLASGGAALKVMFDIGSA